VSLFFIEIFKKIKPYLKNQRLCFRSIKNEIKDNTKNGGKSKMKESIKKVLIIARAIIMVFTLAACGSGNVTTSVNEKSPTPEIAKTVSSPTPERELAPEPIPEAMPEPVLPLAPTASPQNFISAGKQTVAAIREDGTVMSTNINHSEFNNWTNITAVAVSNMHLVGLKADGTVVFDGSEYTELLHEVREWTDIVAISTNERHIIGLKRDGTVVAAGNDNQGSVSGVSDWTDIVAISAGSTHTVGVKSDGSVVTVGKFPFSLTYGESFTDTVAVAAGSQFTVFLSADATVHSVGASFGGRHTKNKWTDVVALSVSNATVLALRADGTVYADSRNDSRRLSSAMVNQVGDWSDIIAVSAEQDFAIGLKSDGTLVYAGQDNQREYAQDAAAEWAGIRTNVN